MLPRRLHPVLLEDLREKMVLLSGPRQCGKTTLAHQLLEELPGAYFNWDVAPHRKVLRELALPASAPLWVFDEIHKLRTWRNWLKGVYDLHHQRHAILVTGSARLDLYSRGGDSLQGRYFHHRLHPVTLSELEQVPLLDPGGGLPELAAPSPSSAQDRLVELLALGGFPEPLFAASARKASRWRTSYGTRLVREEVRDLESIRDLDKLELLFDRLADTVGSVLSINALREDLEVSFDTAKAWLGVFERLCAVFRVAPFGSPRIRAVKKEQKLYFWDWGRVEALPARFENLVMMHLLRLTHWMTDVHGERTELRYFRTVAGHEVDAVVLRNGKPWFAVAIKLEDRPLDAGLRYLLERQRFPHAYQVSLLGTADRRWPEINGCEVRQVPAARFLVNLP